MGVRIVDSSSLRPMKQQRRRRFAGEASAVSAEGATRAKRAPRAPEARLSKQGTTEAEGSDLNVEMYCMGIDDETSLMFIGMVDKTADAKYAEAIEKAKNSVIK